jgi:hypothetical protein
MADRGPLQLPTEPRGPQPNEDLPAVHHQRHCHWSDLRPGRDRAGPYLQDLGYLHFAQGAVATAAAYVFYWLQVDHVDWKIAFLLSVFVLGPLLGLLLELIGRHLAPQRTAMRIVGTVGIIVLVQGLATIKYGPNALRRRSTSRKATAPSVSGAASTSAPTRSSSWWSPWSQ